MELREVDRFGKPGKKFRDLNLNIKKAKIGRRDLVFTLFNHKVEYLEDELSIFICKRFSTDRTYGDYEILNIFQSNKKSLDDLCNMIRKEKGFDQNQQILLARYHQGEYLWKRLFNVTKSKFGLINFRYKEETLFPKRWGYNWISPIRTRKK